MAIQVPVIQYQHSGKRKSFRTKTPSRIKRYENMAENMIDKENMINGR
jgi:glutamate formiminotransferase